MDKNVLGHIDCPTCGTAGGMRITRDRNGAPFGFCEAKCRQQLRVGGDPYRVALFVQRYPWAAEKPVTVTGENPAPEPVPAPATKPPAAAPAPTPAPKPKAGWFTPILGASNG